MEQQPSTLTHLKDSGLQAFTQKYCHQSFSYTTPRFAPESNIHAFTPTDTLLSKVQSVNRDCTETRIDWQIPVGDTHSCSTKRVPEIWPQEQYCTI